MAERVEVTLYTRADCSLCDKARTAIKASGVRVKLNEVNVDDDPVLRRRYGNDVPVVVVGEVEAFRHRVDPDAFAAFVRQRKSGAKSTLAREKCVPCRGGVPPLKGDELDGLARDLGGAWRVVDEHHLEKNFTFPDFAQALSFANAIGAIAEREGHHPDIYLAWGKVGITLWTHKVDGLTRSDFVLAAKIDAI
jgi:4a-hydroxytetrahydrobiopterin dehydratase